MLTEPARVPGRTPRRSATVSVRLVCYAPLVGDVDADHRAGAILFARGAAAEVFVSAVAPEPTTGAGRVPMRRLRGGRVNMFNAMLVLGALVLIGGCGQANADGAGSDGTAGAFQSSTGGAASLGGAGGVDANGGAFSEGGAGAVGASDAIVCKPSSFTASGFNGERIGAGCNPRAPEGATCGNNVCIARVLDDRWPRSDGTLIDMGHCTKNCDTDADCGSGHTCCEVRAAGAFCLTRSNSTSPTGCSEPCASNHLGCNEDQICCERLGRLCVSEHCSGVCLD